ncbi:hypothetical protein PG994_013375 [Apiospora phragmitis]|uniref:DUF7082 domain-containing protein n=1 Tax=Apiospora phragmitis TaxID=2905665 RepID=A0ABR1T8Z1_9PEZI
MSAVKFAYQPYKLFEPQFHPERPIIVDSDVESPETVTLRYEEEAARANGGGLRGDSPPGLLSMSTAYSKPQPPQMHEFESTRSYQNPQYQYPVQPFSAHQSQNAAAAQLNQMAFAANGSSQYMPAAPVVPSLLSYEPNSGVPGAGVTIRISAPFDLLAIANRFYLEFGDCKCSAHAAKDMHDTSGYSFVVSATAPQFEDTRCNQASVPLVMSIEGPEGNLLGNLLIEVGTFTYHEIDIGSAESPQGDVTRRVATQSPDQRENTPKQQTTEHITDNATNTYGYPPADQQAAAPSYDPTYASNNTNNNNMIGTYHRTSYADGFRHIPPPIKASTSWSYGSSLSSVRSPGILHPIPHTTITRPSLSSLPAPTSNAPQLVRTSTLQTSGSPGSSQFNPYALYSTKAVLKIAGDLDSMATGWNKEEWENRRRIVMFKKSQAGSTLTATFKPVGVNERPTNSICISCIYYAEKNECFVTSVDTIYLLEQLVAAPARFTVEEKNRIRRNLEGFRPQTVSKAKAESEESSWHSRTPAPQYREGREGVSWKILAQALKKIISKYSASPSSTLPPGPGSALLTPVSSTSPGLYPPPHTPRGPDAGGYPRSGHHIYNSTLEEYEQSRAQGALGAATSWAPYPTRAPESPPLKSLSQSAAAGGMRMPSLSSYGSADTRHSVTTASSYDMAPQPQTRWDPAVTNGYLDTASYGNHHHQGQLYGTAGYADGGQRA